MENKIKSYVLALLTLLATSLFAAEFETTKFGAKAGKDGINTAAGQAETYADFWKLVGSKETPPESVAMDGIVAVQNYVALTNGLAKAGVPFAARLEPYRHCKILSGKPETRPWLYENLRKHLKENEAK